MEVVFRGNTSSRRRPRPPGGPLRQSDSPRRRPRRPGPLPACAPGVPGALGLRVPPSRRNPRANEPDRRTPASTTPPPNGCIRALLSAAWLRVVIFSRTRFHHRRCRRHVHGTGHRRGGVLPRATLRACRIPRGRRQGLPPRSQPTADRLPPSDRPVRISPPDTASDSLTPAGRVSGCLTVAPEQGAGRASRSRRTDVKRLKDPKKPRKVSLHTSAPTSEGAFSTGDRQLSSARTGLRVECSLLLSRWQPGNVARAPAFGIHPTTTPPPVSRNYRFFGEDESYLRKSRAVRMPSLPRIQASVRLANSPR